MDDNSYDLLQKVVAINEDILSELMDLNSKFDSLSKKVEFSLSLIKQGNCWRVSLC
jgi:hypothetical protein